MSVQLASGSRVPWWVKVILFLALAAALIGGVATFRAMGSGGGETAALYLREGATLEEIRTVLEQLLTEPREGGRPRYVEGIDSVTPGGYFEGHAILDLHLERRLGAEARDDLFRRLMASPLVDTVAVVEPPEDPPAV